MHRRRREPARANGHDAVRARELHRVRQKVVEDLFELRVIGLDLADFRRHIDLERDSFARGKTLHDLTGAIDRAAHGELLREDLHLPRFDFRQIEDVIDDGEEMLA